MADYRAPQREIQFVLHDVLNVAQLAEFERYRDATPDIIDGAVEEAAKFIEARIRPLSEPGDRQGCRLADDTVELPDGYVEAYREFWQSGWVGLAHDPQWGGQGLPYLLSKVVEEMVCSANVAFALYPGLTTGCFDAIEAHGTQAQKEAYLPRLASGEWTGTMCMTEPQAGSDVGAVRTTASPESDGSYRLNGSKIFITSGEHTMVDNIIHFVLARLPDSPPGVKGLSTFVVPKFLLDADGHPGGRNNVRCVSIEHKMGINGSCTCTMAFDDAVGYMIGQPNQGIQNMFTMMNLARIMVGFQGLGQAELATQNAINYALERVQGRTFSGVKDAPIADHPDVRRMLMTMKAYTEAARVMAYETALHVDLVRCHPEAAAREAAQDWVDLTTPLVKAFCTDLAVENGSTAIQVYGGHGFISEHGIEQIARDSKILCLYEGTNGIQAMDLVRRKLQLHGGRLPQQFFERLGALLADTAEDAELSFLREPLAAALSQLRSSTDWVRSRFGDAPEDAGAIAVDYLRAFTLVMLGYNWLRMCRAAVGDAERLAAKTATARYFAARLLPQAEALLRAAEAGGAAGIMEMPARTLLAQ